MIKVNLVSIHVIIVVVLAIILFPGTNYLRERAVLAGPCENQEREYWPTESWVTTEPGEQHMNASKINDMFEYVSSSYDVHGVVVIKNGFIVFEQYPDAFFGVNTNHHIWSCTKSFTSALIGIAIEKGYISSVNDRIIDFFPEYTFDNLDSRKEQITIKHLLTMTSGIEWDEHSTSYSNPRNSLNLIRDGDVVQNFLNLPVVYDPGDEWVYNSGGPLLMSYLLYKLTGQKPLDFANEHLFGALGIDATWAMDNNGVHDGQGGLSLTPRDLAKFGYLFLNNGTWDDQQLVTAEWVKNSTRTVINNTKNADSIISGYGLHWWTAPEYGLYYASGMYGQQLIVDPERDLIAVFTAHITQRSFPWIEAFRDYLIPAVMENDRDAEAAASVLTIETFIVAVIIVSVRKRIGKSK